MTRPTPKQLLRATCALSALALTAPAALAEETIELDEITVSGGLKPQPLSQTASSVEIVDEETLQDAPVTLSQALSREPGVSYSQSGPLGGNSSLSIRGLPARYIGVQIDGIDMTDPSALQTQFDFGGMTTSGLGRVEILKGSQSALYGSEAIGGVVDIQTARPTKLGFSTTVAAEGGSYGTYRGTLMLGYKDDRGEVALNVSKVKSDGFSALAADTEADGVDETLTTLTLRYALSDSFTLGGAVILRDMDYQFDNTATDPSGDGTSKQHGFRVFGEFTTGAVSHELSYSHLKTELNLATSTYTFGHVGERDTISYVGAADLGGAMRTELTFGLDYKEEKYAGLGKADTTSAYGEVMLHPGDIDLALALRYDDHSQFGGQLSGRLGPVWHVSPDTDLRAVVSTGFRAPSLNELYGPFGGNPALKPEESRSAELGVAHRFGTQGQVKATLFYTEVDNLIQYLWPTGYVQVAGTSVSKGAELSGDYALRDGLKLYGAYTYTDARDETGARLVQVPRNTFVLGLDAQLAPRLSGNFEVRRAADALPNPFAPAASKVGSYTLLNAGLDYAVTDTATAYIRVENLTDEDYQTVGGYNQPGRSVFFGVRAAF